MKVNVLVFPAGEVNSVELHDSLATCVNVSLFGASSLDRHGEYVFENYISGLPMITDSGFIDKFNSILDYNKIDVIFPTHDTVLEFLSENAHKVHAKIINGDKETAQICRDKRKQYTILSDSGILPKVFEKIESFPVFLKPRRGQGGVGAFLAKSSDDLPKNLDDYVITEYLPGEEVSIDCLTDKDGKLVVVAPRLRMRTMAGICTHGENFKEDPVLMNMANEINKRLKLRGLWFFQAKRNAVGEWKFLECAARIASTMCLTRARGLNLPLMSIYVAMGLPVSAMPNKYSVVMDRTLISRYKIDYQWNKAYIDFDDTIVVRGRVNLRAIWFLYQCKNENRSVILLTKHKDEIYVTLQKYAIPKELFTSIIHLNMHEEKSSVIEPLHAIFIDNAFQERVDVATHYGIPVFDVDGIEVLMDWRV